MTFLNTLSLAALSAAVLVSSAAAAQPAGGDWRNVDAANTMVIDTNKGRIFVELYPDVAPASVAQIESLTRRGFYDGLTFFRVIDGFMDQTGDPKNTGEGGSDLPNLKAEFRFRIAPGSNYPVIAKAPSGEDAVFVGAMPAISQPAGMAALTADGKVTAIALFCTGVMGVARASDPGSGNSQFFLMRGMKLALDDRYAAVGRVVAGQSVVNDIKTGEPVDPPRDRMTKVQILADMPAAQRPTVRVLDSRSAYFGGLVASAKAAKGQDFSPCDVDVPSQVQ